MHLVTCNVCSKAGQRVVIDGLRFCPEHAEIVQQEKDDGVVDASIVASRLRGELKDMEVKQ